MPLEEMVFGEEISRQEDEASGWIVAHSRKKQRQDFTPGDSPGPSASNSAAHPAHPKGPINKVVAASRLPRLPKDHYRVVERPKGGMDVRNVSRIKRSFSGIDIKLSDDRLGELFVHAINPKVLGVWRIEQTPTVIVLLDGMKVPNYVMCGMNMIRCTLYRRQIDACRTCGKLGHRSDVYPTPTVITCPDCGVSSPPENYTCQPKCSICGGAHPTADRACKSRYQVPYTVRRRRRRRRKAKKQRGEFVPLQAAGLGVNQGGGLDTPGPGAGHRFRSRDRSASCVRIQQEPTWAELVGQKRESRTIVQRQLPRQATARIQQLERENATLRSELQEIEALVEELRQRERTPEGAVEVQQAEAQP
ncbi:hypothetical protein HPB52_005085 [Rhipicephalus sanguineus]|uniref:Uncharacterized protein n=1 Tax=Rhipicephalus sanguineus TaxID=34632 RepID=A0A9D4Q5F0_RHISA|nr:hypothetical protein HPB52_005085 [Rhipicephalus sanguineus]